MGDFRIVIEGTGSHGCGRGTESPEGVVVRCGSVGCSDCAAIAAVALVKQTGSVSVALVEHWPIPGAAGTRREDNPGPRDNLLNGRRYGRF